MRGKRGGHVWQERLPLKRGGTHPTGMHSFSAKGLLWKHIVSKIKSTLDPIPTPLKNI